MISACSGSFLGSAQVGSVPHVSSILFGDTMVPNIEKDSILLLGYSILCKGHNLNRFNHPKNTTHVSLLRLLFFKTDRPHLAVVIVNS